MSSEQGFRGVPGVPEGWELVRIDFVTEGEWYAYKGKASQWTKKESSDCTFPIIRKIEVPKQYRPFANGGEYVANRSHGIVDWKSNDAHQGFFAVVAANAPFVWVSFGKNVEVFDWQQAFERLAFRHVDGSTSPFGVEITSENPTS